MNASTGSTIVIGMLAVAAARDTPDMINTLQAAAVSPSPSTTIQLVLPIDVVELVKAVFTGLAALGSAFAAIYAVIGAARAKRAEVLGKENRVSVLEAVEISKTTSKQMDGLLADRDKGKVEEGEAKGAAAGERIAEAVKEGQRQEAERASVQTASDAAIAPAPAPSEAPVSVADATKAIDSAKATVEAAEETVKVVTQPSSSSSKTFFNSKE